MPQLDHHTATRAISIYNWVMQFVKYQDIKELSREAVVTMIDRIYVYEDGRIKIDFNYRDEIARY